MDLHRLRVILQQEEGERKIEESVQVIQRIVNLQCDNLLLEMEMSCEAHDAITEIEKHWSNCRRDMLRYRLSLEPDRLLRLSEELENF